MPPGPSIKTRLLTAAFATAAVPLVLAVAFLPDPPLSALLVVGLFAFSTAGLAVWLSTQGLASRMRSMNEAALRYRSGDLTPTRLEYGDDELGAVARGFDDAIQELSRRLAELARDRGRME